MAMISDPAYALHAIRLSALRTTDDPLTPRIVTVDSAFAFNPYVSAMGLGDIDRWPEIKRALESPPPEPEPLLVSSGGDGDWTVGAGSLGGLGPAGRRRGPGGLRYTQTIMGNRSGGAGMRVSGRRVEAGEIVGRRLGGVDRRANSSSHDMRPPVPGPRNALRPVDGANGDPFAAQLPRPRSGSAPISATAPARDSVLVPRIADDPAGLVARSVSETSGEVDDDLVTQEDGTLEDGGGDADDVDMGLRVPSFGGMMGDGLSAYPGSSMGVAVSALPSDLTTGVSQPLADPLAGEAVDEGSDVDEDEVVDEDEPQLAAPPVVPPLARRPSQALRDSHAHAHYHHNHARVSVIHEEDRRSSTDSMTEPLEFTKVAVGDVWTPPPTGLTSALTAALNQHMPHLVSTGSGVPPTVGGAVSGGSNPYNSLYASIAAPATVPSLSLELFFPHCDSPSGPIRVSVRKDATVEEVTGYGLYRYWEEGREPKIEEPNGTVDWGLRIVEDDGEVDEDFPPLDRESQISKFSYEQFGIVEATDTQKKQNAAMAPLIQRRPSRVIVDHSRLATPVIPATPASAGAGPPPMRRTGSLAPEEGATAAKSSGSSSAPCGGRQVLLRVRVSASADVHFTTTISVPTDLYIADLTEVLVQRKHLPLPASDWVLCLADLTLALPLDRTVASLENETDLALVRRQWAAEHGLRPRGVRGGDPSASIFSERGKRGGVGAERDPMPLARMGTVLDVGQPYKKWTVQRKTPIGRHERVLAIDGDYIHILPSENRAFFDTMKSTSFHVTLVASCKLSGRAGNPGFKIYVWRDGSRKRYEFEAENGKQAAEIIASVKELMKTFQAERNTVLAPMRTM